MRTIAFAGPKHQGATHRNFLAILLLGGCSLALAGCAGLVAGKTTNSVNPPPVAPTLSAQPTSQSVTVGQTATFTVVATGTAPLSYQWQKNGASLGGATAASYTTPAVAMADNGETFQVVVSNAAGSMTSSAATLTVTASAVAPSITTQPASQTVSAGQTATFTVAATGTAPLTYQWSKGGTAISGATAASYTTPATTSTDNGAQFTVKISNTAGNVTSNAATLTVSSTATAPAITTQPASLTVNVGQTATFTVVATGTAPLSYQWSKGGTALSGATAASYTTPATTSADNGTQFTVKVSNTAGSATSSAATLTVNSGTTQPPTVPTGLTATAVSSSQINLSWTASTDSTGTLAGYKIYRGGAQIATSTTTSYQNSGLAASTTYTYNVAAYDTAGNTSAQSSSASATTPASTGGNCTSGTALAQAACNLTPGVWTEFTAAENSSWNNGALLNTPGDASDNGADWSNKILWNPPTNEAYFYGGAHCGAGSGCAGTLVFFKYADATNTWTGLTPSSIEDGHTYEAQTINTTAGSANAFYHRDYDSDTVESWSIGSQAWTSNLSSVPASNFQCCNAIEYFPDRNSLITVDGDYGIYEYSFSNNQWSCFNGTNTTPCGTSHPMASYYVFAFYDPIGKRMWIGGDTNVYTIASSGAITAQASAPFSIGSNTSFNPVTVDPLTGNLLAFNGSSYYTSDGSSWVQKGSTPFSNASAGGLVCGPISTYGVVMCIYAGTNTASVTSGKVYLYKSGATTPPPIVSVAVSPGSASIQTSATQQFTATVTGSSNTSVTWTATGGTVSASGLFTAPSTAGSYTVTATSVADTTKSASATVTVASGTPAVSVTISPTAATLLLNATQQFTATVTGSTNTAVTWTATGGTVGTAGLYTAPGAAGSFTVTATSVADTTKSASAAVTVSATTGAVNGWTSRIAGTNVPGGVASIVSNQPFDVASDIPTCPSGSPGSSYSPGAQFYTSCWAGQTAPAQDCTVAADGPCSLKFTVLNGSFQGDSGSYDYNFSANLATTFGAGQEFYIQYKERMDPGLLGTFSGAGGLKHDITTEGDTATKQAGDCSNSPAEIVTIQNMAFNGPWMYVNCGFSSGTDNFTNVGYEPLQLPGAPGTNYLDQNATGCPHYAGQGGIPVADPTCFLYVGNEWFTVQKHIKIGAFGSPNSVIEQWFAHPGGVSVLVSQAADADIPNDGSGGASGKYGKIQLSTYDTGATFNVGTAAWFDDLIVSTRRIPDPDVSVPNAPDSLSLSNISATSVTVNWRVNSQNGTAQDDTGFLVERCAGAGATCFPNPQSGFAVIATTAAGASSYVDSTVVAGTTYTYRVRAKNASGNSAYTIAQCFNGGTTCGGTVAVP